MDKIKKSWIIWGAVVFIILLIYFSFSGRYNNMVKLDENVTNSWSQVQNMYQRRLDLIPNLVNTVKGYAKHEKETLEGVIEARSKATAVNINANNLTADNLKKFQSAQDGLSSALSKLMVVVERYPDLKANQNFLELQAQLEGTENRIANSRRMFNDAVQLYNTTIRQFPQNIFANVFGFQKKAYFEAEQNAQKAPKVEF